MKSESLPWCGEWQETQLTSFLACSELIAFMCCVPPAWQPRQRASISFAEAFSKRKSLDVSVGSATWLAGGPWQSSQPFFPSRCKCPRGKSCSSPRPRSRKHSTRPRFFVLVPRVPVCRRQPLEVSPASVPKREATIPLTPSAVLRLLKHRTVASDSLESFHQQVFCIGRAGYYCRDG